MHAHARSDAEVRALFRALRDPRRFETFAARVDRYDAESPHTESPSASAVRAEINALLGRWVDGAFRPLTIEETIEWRGYVRDARDEGDAW